MTELLSRQLRGERERLKSSKLPLYVTLVRLLTSEIEGGRWAEGEQLPTIGLLAKTYGVAPVTIRQALGVLADGGLIKTIQGKGSFVAHRQPLELIHLESSWTHLLHALDGNIAELLEVRDDVVLPKSALQFGSAKDRYRHMRRIHRRKSVTYCIIELYVDAELYESNPERFDTEMVIPLVSLLVGSALKRMDQTFRISTASLETAKLLGIPPGAPTGEVTRVITHSNSDVLYVGAATYRGDLVVFNTSIEAPKI